MSTSSLQYKNNSDFSIWIRTGLWPVPLDEKQGNPYHDPNDGRFTSGPGGARSATTKPARPDVPKNPIGGGRPPKASPNNIAHGTNSSKNQVVVENFAYTTIKTRLALPGVTSAAHDQLTRFVDGMPESKSSTNYLIGSAGSNEMRDSDYSRELNTHVQSAIAKRNGGKIPDGNYS